PPQQPNTSVRFYIEALSGDNWNTAAYEPAGAVNDVYYYKVVPVHLTNSQVVINELMSDNVSAVQDPNGDYDDWVEFYNKSGENIDLSGYYLSDKEDQLTLWQFPDNTEINAGGYLIVWCDDEAGQPGLHAGFALSKNGESLFFTTPDLEIADEVTFGDSDPDMAFARVPNGTGNFVWQEHTFNGPNNVAFSSPVIINELMALNTASVQDPNGEYDDWVELYNTSGDTMDISGYHFSDDPEELSKWQFPAGTAINGYSYLIVWCDGDNGQPGIHASFTLNDESGSLFLTSPNLEAVDEVLYNDVSADLGFARMPNGTGEFIWQVHTFSQHNGPFVNCQVVLNELMPDNVSAVTDPDGEYDDWLELFNNAEEAFDLSGFFLSDKNDELDRWAFPEGTIIGGNDYLIVWCDDDLTQTGLHAGFSLSKNGEQVFFTSPYIQILDSTSFGPAFPDTAFARMPNGTGSFVWQAHTIGANNDPSIMVPEVSSLNPEFIFFPNPATDHLTLLPKTAEETVVTVYSLLGDIVFQKVIDQKTQLHTGNWPRGIYVIGAGKGMMKKLILQ
ncbi:MAG: T9SS type A sorting domain-containing protein, partial [Sphingobacteriia bacterium]|nr:T9SS type A sorting domain-containing protein [Sphingobacteriia bacterium]